MGQSDLVVVQAFGTQAEAEIAQGILESSGIAAMTQADTAGGMRQHLAWSGLGFRVLVREEDLAVARDLLNSGADQVVLKAFSIEDEADRALDALLSAGIAARIEHDNFDYSRGGAPLKVAEFRLLVYKDDVETARRALEPPKATPDIC